MQLGCAVSGVSSGQWRAVSAVLDTTEHAKWWVAAISSGWAEQLRQRKAAVAGAPPAGAAADGQRRHPAPQNMRSGMHWVRLVILARRAGSCAVRACLRDVQVWRSRVAEGARRKREWLMRLERGEEWLCYEDLEELLAQAPGEVVTLLR